MIKRERHTNNGVFCGIWYTLPDGRQLYLAHFSGEKPKGLIRNHWCLEASVLRQAEQRGCASVGVVHRAGRHKYLYLTNVADMWGSESGVAYINSMMQRTLLRSKFMVNPSVDRELINAHIRLR